MKTPRNYAKDRIQHHILTRRAHLVEQTGAPRKMHKRIRIRVHVSACRRRIRMRGGQVGPADPIGRPNLAGLLSRCIRGGVAAKASDHLPYLHLAGTNLQGYK